MISGTASAYRRPRLAICGLNPHAGEEGTLGREDEEVTRPAVEALRRRESTPAVRFRQTHAVSCGRSRHL